MSKIEDLISPKREVTFRDEKFNIEAGFTIEETPMINMAFGKQPIEVRSEGLKMLLKVIAKRLYPTASDEQLSKIDAKYIDDLLKVFFQLDESTPEDIKKVKAILKKEK